MFSNGFEGLKDLVQEEPTAQVLDTWSNLEFISLQASITKYNNVCATFDNITEWGYTPEIIQSMGGSSFNTLIGLTDDDIQGKSNGELREIYRAGIFDWVARGGRLIVDKIIQFIKWIIRKIMDFIRNRRNKNIDRLVFTIANLRAIPEDLECVGVIPQEELATRVEGINSLITILVATMGSLAEGVRQRRLTNVDIGWPDVVDYLNRKLAAVRGAGFAPAVGGSNNFTPLVYSDTNEVNLFESGWISGSKYREMTGILTRAVNKTKDAGKWLKTMEDVIPKMDKALDEAYPLQIPKVSTVVLEFITHILQVYTSIQQHLEFCDTKFTELVDYTLRAMYKYEEDKKKK